MTTGHDAGDLEILRKRIAEAQESHTGNFDSFAHNGGTALSIGLAAAATILVVSVPVAAQICTAAATAVIALSRALDYGGRWRWHIAMQSRYESLQDRLATIHVLGDPKEERTEIKAVRDDFISSRLLEMNIPGSGAFVETSIPGQRASDETSGA